MASVSVHGPEGKLDFSEEVEPGQALLFGRDPKPSSLPHAASAVEVAKIPGMSVSSNHLLVAREADRFVVEDLDSRNGTWLRLPPRIPVTVPAGDLVVELARSKSPTRFIDEPPSAEWKTPDDYAGSLLAAIQRWELIRELDVEVKIARQSEVSTHSVPLANGDVINILPRGTASGHSLDLLERLWRWVSRQNSVFKAEAEARAEGMVLASRGIRAALHAVIEASKSEAPTLLLCGPSGAGKEMLAAAFHRNSARSGPFVAVNCSMFGKELLRAELFGAEAGSFTGASRRIIGAVERAQGGTLFLDEIGELPEDVQPMLLRFLDRFEFEPLGQYGKARIADVRVVAATNRNLREQTRSGKFRSDLWYRLSVHVVDVPPLSERWEDISAYLERTPAPGSSLPVMKVLNAEALSVLKAHSWEGNFRELTNFRNRLPHGAARASIDAATCVRILRQGSLGVPAVVSPTPTNDGQLDFGATAARATEAFLADFGRAPATWDEQKEWNEKYFKPLLFFQLSQAEERAPQNDEQLGQMASRCATRLNADRGTALKQLRRYYERFARHD